MTQDITKSGRLISLDVMRGLIMILLAAESAQVYVSLHELHLPGILSSFVEQFFHHPWNGLYFWDLVQPAFMTIAGTAMYISYAQKSKKGISWEQNFRHIALRSLKLFAFGTALHCVYAGQLVWELWNVLTQLALTSLIAYLIIRRSALFQMIVSVLLILLTDVLYRVVAVPGFDQPYVEFHNFGAFMDTVLMGKIDSDGWVAMNFIPTAAHTIWGALIGKLLIGSQTTKMKIRILLITGITGLLIGYGLDGLDIIPIIKRTCTGSFVYASGGWVVLIYAFLYWFVDLRKNYRYAWVATVVGMNSIFIYLFFETVGHQWINPTMGVFVKGFFSLLQMPEPFQNLTSALVVLLAEWYLCYWLFKKKIFFKI